jgi:hypothetical protein
MPRFRPFPTRPAAAVLIAAILSGAPLVAQTPIPNVPQKPPGPVLGLPPGPPVGDWQPRGRAVSGGTIVVTGQNFRPADFQAAIGSAKVKLPVRLASSTATRIELEVPDAALGQLGTLAVGYPGTQGTILETSYRIDMPTPSVIDATAGTSVTPFLKRNLVVRVREFTGVKANADNITFGGTCGFRKHGGVSYGTIDRAADLSLRIGIDGWFEKTGTCQLEVHIPAIAANGASAGTVHVSTPFTVAAPQRYTFENTADLTPKLKPQLVHFGVGSVCQTPITGVTTSGSDLQIKTIGGPLDVECVFQTAPWLLPAGVRLAEIRWRSTTTGNRCGRFGTFSHTFPSVGFTFARGATIVRPDLDQAPSEFIAFGDNTVVDDGVTFGSNLNGPRTVIKPFVMATQCVSMAIVLHTAQGSFGPTTALQEFTYILDRIVLEGPPGLSTADLLK